MTVPESHWEGSAGEYTLLWGGRPWTLKVDDAEPGLHCGLDRCVSKLLSLHGLAEAGRFETRVFSPDALVVVERYRSRVQATFAPPGWGGLTVRAAWSPSCNGAGVDLEIQAAATTVDQLRAVEVVVQSQWRAVGDTDASPGVDRRVLPRDARSAALSYDGREALSDLRGLTTLPVLESPRPRVFTPPGTSAGTYYLEMVQPNDVARQTRLEPTEPRLPLMGTLALRYGLFGHDFEKGVVFRARLRACWLSTENHDTEALALYDRFLNEPPPLGP